MFFIAGSTNESRDEVIEAGAGVVDEVSEDDGQIGIDSLQREIELVLAGVELQLSRDGWTFKVGEPFDKLAKNVEVVHRTPPLAFVVGEQVGHGVTSPWMADKPQEPAETDWEGEGGSVEPEPKQTTPKGLEIPVPTRGSVFKAFQKLVGKPQKGR
jgi:hypothetical protein